MGRENLYFTRTNVAIVATFVRFVFFVVGNRCGDWLGPTEG